MAGKRKGEVDGLRGERRPVKIDIRDEEKQSRVTYENIKIKLKSLYDHL